MIIFGGGNHLRIAVAGVDDGNYRKAVDIFPAVDVGNNRTLCFVDHYRCDRLDKTGHDIFLIFFVGIRDKPHRDLKHRCTLERFNVGSGLAGAELIGRIPARRMAAGGK